MGLFDFLKRGGNFGFIAEVVTTWYCGICNHPKGKALTLPQKIYCAGILDLIIYIQSGKVDEEMIGDCVRRTINRNPDMDEKNCLLDFIHEIEILIFTVDSPRTGLFQIVRQVSEHSDDIERSMLSVLNNKSSAALSKTKPGVINLLDNDELYNAIINFQI